MTTIADAYRRGYLAGDYGRNPYNASVMDRASDTLHHAKGTLL